MSDYDHVQKGSLKLKKSALSVEPSIKKKKKHRKSEELKNLQAKEILTAGEPVEEINNKAASDSNKKTKAELAFQKTKEERMVNEITTKVSKSHKERIMEFNQYLDNLSEHYDIPKVSWTK